MTVPNIKYKFTTVVDVVEMYDINRDGRINIIIYIYIYVLYIYIYIYIFIYI